MSSTPFMDLHRHNQVHPEHGDPEWRFVVEGLAWQERMVQKIEDLNQFIQSLKAGASRKEGQED